jgi:hypothetical protein
MTVKPEAMEDQGRAPRILPFELTIGTALLLRGIRTRSEPPQGIGVATRSSARPGAQAR